jgi:ribosomal protein L11 methyltransferase
MLWKEITFTCQKSDVTSLEDYMLELGACSVTFKDAKNTPILEPSIGETPLWDQVQLTSLFTEEYDIRTLSTQIKQNANLKAIALETRTFADEDWERTWMDNFHPIQFGPRLWVCPSWEEIPEPDAVNILLDPGLAFGTGTHETTALCLAWLDENIKGQESVIDYGCGSGILAIVAKKLGAASVCGIDIDPQAIIATRDNAEKNNIHPATIQIYMADDQPASLQSDIVVANILAGILIDLSEHITAKVKPHGKIVLSGILKDQVEAVLLHYSQTFDMSAPIYRNEWALLTGTKK